MPAQHALAATDLQNADRLNKAQVGKAPMSFDTPHSERCHP